VGTSPGTKEIHFGRKVNEIAKFWTQETKFTISDEIWIKKDQVIAKKWPNSFMFIGVTIVLLQFG